MKTEPIENLYPKIGQTIADLITEEWQSIWVDIEIKPDVTTLKGHYITAANSAQRSIRITHQVVALFQELHSRMATEMKDDWVSAHFEITRAGKFSLKLEYSNE